MCDVEFCADRYYCFTLYPIVALPIEGEEVEMKIVEGPTIQRYGFQ